MLSRNLLLGVRLLADIKAAFIAEEVQAIPSAVLVKLLVEMEDRPWVEIAKGKPLTTNKLAAILRRYEVEPRTVRRSCGANFDTPMFLADSFTMCQTAFTVIPSPHALPTLLTRRNSLPRSIAAAATQSFNSLLTQSGTGTVRTWPSLADQINNCPMLFALLEMIQCQGHSFMPPQATRE